MIEKELLYKVLDFEVNWNKYHLVKQHGYILRLQQIIDLFDKLYISENTIIYNKQTSNNLRTSYLFVKNGMFLNYIGDNDLLEGASFRLKKIIQNSKLKNKYPHFIDFEFNFQIIFQKLFILRCSLYKLEKKSYNFNAIESIETDIEHTIYQNIAEKLNAEINEIDLILEQLINPFNKNINLQDILHYNIDFSHFNIT